DHRGGSGWTRQGLPIQVVFENRFNTLIRTRTDADGALAGSFEAAIAVAFAQPHDAQTRTEALLGVRPRGEDGFAPCGRGCARFRCPGSKRLGCPFDMVPVRLGHVSVLGAVTALVG